jgi:hypothetical protein
MTTIDRAASPRESSAAPNSASSATTSNANNKGKNGSVTRENAAAASAAFAASLGGAPTCPKCSSRMWDNRLTKRNTREPDFKCRNPRCDGVLWPGQHKTPPQIIARPAKEPNDAPATVEATTPAQATASAAAEEDEQQTSAEEEAAASQRKAEQQQAARAALRQCYLDVTDFVLAEVRPKYQDAGVPLGDSTVAAITATLFIQTCKPRWEGGT